MQLPCGECQNRGRRTIHCVALLRALETGDVVGFNQLRSTHEAFRLDLRGASAPGRRLAGIMLSATNLQDTEFSGANLSGADLSGADLEAARLHGACLEGANLAGAVLRRADISAAVLRNADMYGAVLEGCNFIDADLTGVECRAEELARAAVYRTRMHPCLLARLRIALNDGWRGGSTQRDFAA